VSGPENSSGTVIPSPGDRFPVQASSLPPPPPDGDERVRLRLHVVAHDTWLGPPQEPGNPSLSLEGILGSLFLTDSRLIFLCEPLAGNDADIYEIEKALRAVGGVELPLRGILATACEIRGNPLEYAGQASLSVRFASGDSAAAYTFTIEEFGPEWPGFSIWEKAIERLRASQVALHA